MDSFSHSAPFAARLGDMERRRGRFYAYASTWFGCFAEVMLDSSAIIILYITMLGGSATLSMFSTALTAMTAIFLTIPSAGIADHIGLRRTYALSCNIGCAGYLLMAAAPLAGSPLDKYLVLTDCLIYCLSRPLFGVTWYAMLDNILLPAERGRFFGTMRFSYLSLTAASFFLLSMVLGKNPPVWAMQLVIAATGLMLIGRKLCLDRLPLNEKECGLLDIKKSLAISIRNGPLTGWAIYSCCLALASSSLMPLTLVYLKNEIKANADIVQWISVAYMGGMICGYLLTARLLQRFGVRIIQPAGHVFYILCGFGLFLFGPWLSAFYVIVGVITFGLGFWTANCMCCYSIELMALARPGNKTMSSAYLATFNSIGTASSRFTTSLILGAGVLAPQWSRGGLTFCSYQTLFLLFTVLQIFFLLLLFLVPSIVPKHEDYYEPA